MIERIEESAREVATPMMFSTLIIGVAFLPLFTMAGVSGVIFAPMARTYAFAIGGAICLALTLTPVLASKVIPAQAEEKESVIMRVLHRIYNPAFDLAMKHPRGTLAFSLLPIVLCVVLFPLLGREFMPKLEEGNFWIRATLPTSISARPECQVRRSDAIASSAGARQTPNVPCDEAHRGTSGGRHGRLSARASRRRHGRLGLLQHRVLRPAQAIRRVAPGAHQRDAHRGHQQGTDRGVSRGRVQLLAVHQRQRRRGHQRRQGRELGQGLRTGSRKKRSAGRGNRRRDEPRARCRRPRDVPVPRAAEHPDHPRDGRSARAMA